MKLSRLSTHGRAIGAVLLLWCCASWAQDQQVEPPLEEIAVVGAHKGPQMWRVTEGDHVLWILGTMQPLPKKMTWDSRDVEKVLDEVQEVIPEYISLDVGIVESLRLYPKWRRIHVLKDRQTLKQVLPAELYAHFSALRDRYGSGPTDMEDMQPLFAADRLKEEAIEKSGLTKAADVHAKVLKLARLHDVTVRNLTLKIQDPRDLLQEAEELTIPTQSTACLEPVVETLEKAMSVLKARANAWALGDVQTLRTLQPVNAGGTICWKAAAGTVHIADLRLRLHDLWMDAIKDALRTNRASLAIQDIDSLLGGFLKELRAAGYSIEGPEFSGPAN
jgi:uncharacterized protein YbaP (TraB family)